MALCSSLRRVCDLSSFACVTVSCFFCIRITIDKGQKRKRKKVKNNGATKKKRVKQNEKWEVELGFLNHRNLLLRLRHNLKERDIFQWSLFNVDG